LFFLKAGVYGPAEEHPLKEILSNSVPLFYGYIPFENSTDWVVEECKTGNRLTMAVRKRSPLAGMTRPGAGRNFQVLKPPRKDKKSVLSSLANPAASGGE